MKSFSRMIFLGVSLASAWAWGHARLLEPAPRDNSDSLTVAPCGGLLRTDQPTTVQGGQTLVVKWEETVDHPGKYLVNLSVANDSDFVLFAQEMDVEDAGTLPHLYTKAISVPDIDCDTCTLQLVQVMEEDPLSPTYHYSCADIKIVASTPPDSGSGDEDSGGDGGSGDFGSAAPSEPVKLGGGCGSLGSSSGPGAGPGAMATLLLVFLLPALIYFFLRKRSEVL